MLYDGCETRTDAADHGVQVDEDSVRSRSSSSCSWVWYRATSRLSAVVS